MRPIPWNAPKDGGGTLSFLPGRSARSGPIRGRRRRAWIENPAVILRIFEHLGLWALRAMQSATGFWDLAGARQPAAHLLPSSRHRL